MLDLLSADFGCIQFEMLIVFLKEFFEKGNFEKNIAGDNKSLENYPACKE